MASLAASFSSLTITQNSPKSLNKSFLGASLNPQNLKTRSNSNGLCLKAASVITMSAVTASGGLEKQDLSKYVKSRLLGGFAAQKLIGTGRRKAAVARVVLLEGTGQIIINSRTAQAEGGGLSGQAQAVTLGISRALLKANPENRDPLKKQGLLTRDSRRVERKKFGLHKARKAPQYSKR